MRGRNQPAYDRLSAAEQEALDAMVEAEGHYVAARKIGVSVVLLESVAYGGTARPDSIVKIRAGLARLRGAA